MELSPAMIAQFDKYLKEYMYARILLLSIFVILAVVNQFSDAPFYTPLIKGLRKKYQRLCIIAINIVLLLVFGWFARGVVTSTHEICRDLKESSYTYALVIFSPKTRTFRIHSPGSAGTRQSGILSIHVLCCS